MDIGNEGRERERAGRARELSRASQDGRRDGQPPASIEVSLVSATFTHGAWLAAKMRV